MIQKSLEPLFEGYYIFSKETYTVHNLLNYVTHHNLINVHKNGTNVTIDSDNFTVKENRNLVILVNNRIKKKIKCDVFHDSNIPPNIKPAYELYKKNNP